MIAFGLDPDDTSLDPTTPVGIGNLAAKAVIEARLTDGSNQDWNDAQLRRYTLLRLYRILTGK